jgi:hypothetical protein
MDPLHARADWESVGDKWFRKTQQYTQVFDQDLDLDNYTVAGAPYAGALGTKMTNWTLNTLKYSHYSLGSET